MYDALNVREIDLFMGNAIANKVLFPKPEPTRPGLWSPHLIRLNTNETEGQPILIIRHPKNHPEHPDHNPEWIIFFHENGSDAGSVFPRMLQVARNAEISILIVEYPGYGEWRSGRPCSASINKAAKKAFNYLTKEEGVRVEDILLIGRSIGTAPAAALAKWVSKYKRRQVMGVILLAGFSSIKDIIWHYASIASLIVTNFWDTKRALHHYACKFPVIVLHGTADEVVPYSHAEKLTRNGKLFTLIRVSGLDHNGFNEDCTGEISRFVFETREARSGGCDGKHGILDCIPDIEKACIASRCV